jgi:hypothetical protein
MTRKSAVLSLISILLVTYCSSARADHPLLTDMFLRCDGLLGRDVKPVLASLGPPDATDPILIGGKTIVGIHWTYYRDDPHKSHGSVLILTFSQKHLLYAANYMDGNPNASEMAKILRTYKPASLKFGYYETLAKGDAGTNVNTLRPDIGFNLKATSKNNNSVYGGSFDTSNNPLIMSHKFDANTGLYKDTYSPNPDFTISSIDSPCSIVIWSPAINKGPWAMYTAVTLPDDFSNMHFIPLTAKIFPALLQP